MKNLITMAIILALSIGVNFANKNLLTEQLDLSSITKPEKEIEEKIPTKLIDLSSITKPETEVEDEIPFWFNNLNLASITKPEQEVEDEIPSWFNNLNLASITKPEKEVENEIPQPKDRLTVRNKIQNFFQANFSAPESHTIAGIVYMYVVKNEVDSYVVVASDEPELKKYVENKLIKLENDIIELFAQNHITSVSIHFKYLN